MTAAFEKLSKYTDLIGAGAIVLVVVMMIVPLPPQLLAFVYRVAGRKVI